MSKKSSRYDKVIKNYYARLAEFDFQGTLHEGAVSEAFQVLLNEAGRLHKWTLIPQLTRKGIRPDGTLKDSMNLVRGHWEAKDTDDNLQAEIARKIKKGYPLGNIIFEDTRQAELWQNKGLALRADLKKPEQLASLLDAFFNYTEPQIEGFEAAITEFKERVPELATALKNKVADAHGENKPFKVAFARFFELCQTSLNPAITKEAVDDMLVQHLLTERLIREIFDNPEFTRRNVIAAEIEKVIDALTSKSFNRDVFLKSLDRFYLAIEHAARTITEYSDKQHFLNTVYERFFQGYSVKLADTMGIVYTPQPIVDFMCASVAEVLEKEFGKTLGSPGVNILDPCTGTGNFIVNLLKRIPKRDLPRVYKEQLFANEIMLLPYYIAALNIEHAYFEQTGTYEPFEGLCFVDTLDMAEHAQGQLGFMTAKNSERVERQKKTPITVIIGNPPYNQGQRDENDQNRNRQYSVVDERIAHTFIKESKATLRMQLYDAYVRFFRWAIDRLGDSGGIVAFVTNNGFIQGLSFDSFRRCLSQEFDLIYHLDCKGNARTTGEQRRQEAGNIFSDQIRVGVGISVLVRRPRRLRPALFHYHAVPDYTTDAEKKRFVQNLGGIKATPWTESKLVKPSEWITSSHTEVFRGWVPVGDKTQKRGTGIAKVIFKSFSAGPKSNADAYCYDFKRSKLVNRA